MNKTALYLAVAVVLVLVVLLMVEKAKFKRIATAAAGYLNVTNNAKENYTASLPLRSLVLKAPGAYDDAGNIKFK